MNKKELIKSLSLKMETTQVATEKVVDSFLETIEETLAKGEEINLVGFGKWYIKERKSRIGRNPATGEEIQIPACKVPAFKFGKNVKDAVKG